MDPIAIVTLVVTVIGTIIMYMQLKGQKPGEQKSVKNSDRLENILISKEITIGFFNYPPFVEFDAETDTEPKGYYPTIFQKIASDNNLSIKWQHVNMCDAIDAVNDGDVDFVVSIFQTSKRSQIVNFCCLLHSVKVGGVAKKKLTGIHCLDDLVISNLKILVGKGEIGHELIEDRELPNSRLTVIETADVAEIVSYVESGQSDICILDSVSVKNYFDRIAKRAHGSLKPIFRTNPLFMCLNGIMVARGQSKLSNWLEVNVKKKQKETEVKQIEEDFLNEYHGIVNKN